MKSNHKQTAVKLTASKIGTHVMVQLVTEYGKQCLHQVVFQLYLHTIRDLVRLFAWTLTVSSVWLATSKGIKKASKDRNKHQLVSTLQNVP